MDIIKSNKSTTAQPEAKSLSDSSRMKVSQTSLSSVNQDLQRMEVKEGQIVKGEIIDLRYNEVSVQMEPGKQVVTAKLEGNIPLAIGQTAQFQVTENSPERITLKLVPNETAASTSNTIDKALSASGLALTDRNKAIVEELLNNRMSIDKQTLQTLVKLSHVNREASPLTLVLMNKYNIPMTSSNIAQFESYQNGTHQLLDGIHNISKGILELLQLQTGELPKEAISSGSQQMNSQVSSFVMNEKLLDILNSKPGENISMNTAEAPINNFLGKDELALLSKSIEQKMSETTAIPPSMQADLVKQLGNGTMSLSAAVNLITKIYAEEPDMVQTLTGKDGILLSDAEAAKNNSLDSLLKANNSIQQAESQQSALQQSTSQQSISQQSALQQSALQQSILRQSVLLQSSVPRALIQQVYSQGLMGNSAAPIISSLLDQFALSQGNQTEINNVLNSQERANLSDLIKTFPEAGEVKKQLADGTASINDVLNFVKDGLHLQEESVVKSLLRSPEYSKLIEEAFHQKWTITPDKLVNKDSVTNLYQNLQEDLETLNSLLKEGRESIENSRLQEPVKSLQENLRFMKDLNETFTYLQLPVQFKDKDVHSDLYVFTKKKALQGKKEGLNVLLHLDMANLGLINVHIQMDHNIVQAKFNLENKDSVQIISDYLPTLKSALQRKGYSLHSEVKATYEKPAFCKDFIEQNSKDNNTQRYTFDIRT